MKIVGVIPARYASTRLPGKPLADICGKPMLWWVYQQASQVRNLDKVVVATDDERIAAACASYGIEAMMTSDSHPTHIHRLHEVSHMIDSDLYVCVCGDEPLTKAKTIAEVIPKEPQCDGFMMRTLMREFTDPVEALDPSNIKVVVNAQNECLLLTRSMAPFPYKSKSYCFNKLVGIECYSRSAIDYFVETPAGPLEGIEDITLLRYIENKKRIQLVPTSAYQLGVDTQKDLDYVREVIQLAIQKGEFNFAQL